MTLPEIIITARWKNKKEAEKIIIRRSEDAVEFFRKIFNADQFCWKEEFILLCLNRANQIIGFSKISSGGMTGTVADPRIIFTTALLSGAASIMVAHNHPSDNKVPSRADLEITRKLKESGNMLDINLLDHIILTDDDFYSFADNGDI